MGKEKPDDRPRNWVVPIMRQGRKPGAFVDRKKERNKRRCRKPMRIETAD